MVNICIFCFFQKRKKIEKWRELPTATTTHTTRKESSEKSYAMMLE